MKPLEWIFLIVLYMTDPHPENRIATQYISKQEELDAIEKIKTEEKKFHLLTD